MKVGQKGKYSKEITIEICGYIQDGLTKKDSVALAGLSEERFYKWIKQKPEFREQIKNAELNLKKSLTKKIIDSAYSKVPNSWTAAATFLERRYRDEWGKNEPTAGLLNGLTVNILPQVLSTKQLENNVIDAEPIADKQLDKGQ